MYITDFERSSPQKVVKSAWKFSKTYDKFYQSPRTSNRKQEVDQLANYKTDQIAQAVNRGKQQQRLYRTLEMRDAQQRRKFQQKLNEKYEKAKNKTLELIEKKHKKDEKYNQHFDHVSKQFNQLSHSRNSLKNQKAMELMQQTIDFHGSQLQRKRSNYLKQVNAPTCYKNALSKMDNQHKRSQQFSRLSQKKVNMDSSKSLRKEKLIAEQLQILKKAHENKTFNYNYKQNLFKEKEEAFIQIYANDVEAIHKALKHKQRSAKQISKRIQDDFKQKLEKWGSKKRILDQDAEIVPERCHNAMNKTTVVEFKKVDSSFQKTTQNWRNTVKRNKSLIRNRHAEKNDSFMATQTEITLKNKANFKINEQLESMRARATKLTEDYL